MGIVIGEAIKVNGYTVGTLAECKHDVPVVFDAEYRKNPVYVITGRSE